MLFYILGGAIVSFAVVPSKYLPGVDNMIAKGGMGAATGLAVGYGAAAGFVLAKLLSK